MKIFSLPQFCQDSCAKNRNTQLFLANIIWLWWCNLLPISKSHKMFYISKNIHGVLTQFGYTYFILSIYLYGIIIDNSVRLFFPVLFLYCCSLTVLWTSDCPSNKIVLDKYEINHIPHNCKVPEKFLKLIIKYSPKKCFKEPGG